MEERAASLVYHAGALGDFITTLPALHAWRRIHPKDRMVLIGVPAFAALAEPGLLDETWDVGSRLLASLFAAGRPQPPLSDRLRQFRSALLFASPSSPLERHLSALGVPRILRQDPFPSDRTPIADYHLSLFPGLVTAEADRAPRVRIDAAEAPRVPRPTVALHAGSGSSAKNWPTARFIAIAEAVRKEGLDVSWAQGPAEEGQPVPAQSTVWRGLSLAALAGALSQCRLFVGNDSGVTHLAAASGCPTIALFGPSDPRVWAPRGKTVRIVESTDGRIEGIAESDVLREVRSLLGG
jgi:heptosyltransferase-3